MDRSDQKPGIATVPHEPAVDVARKAFFGMEFACLSLEQAARLIVDRPANASFAFVVTPNVDHVVNALGARRDLLPVYGAAHLCLCDSRVLQLLARCRGVRLSVVTGSDLVAYLFQHIVRPDDALTIIGCTAPAIQKLCAIYGLSRVAHYNPPMNFWQSPSEVDACVAFVAAHPARYVFLAVGSPQQEILAARIAARAGDAVGMGLCVGASLNFLVGAERRAPRWMQRCCLEWLHRLLADPRRLWRRYLLRCPRIFAMLLQKPESAAKPGE
jgi:exopolysaccharide biosynthesis WecB/TagA/CpsF family protein